MTATDIAASAAKGLPPQSAAALQDALLVASHDLERLQRLLSDASNTLIAHFHGANDGLGALAAGSDGAADGEAQQRIGRHLGGAITALQFQDMASQLISHTTRRLRACADRIACEAMADDEDGPAAVEDLPERPNPVTQHEMDAGSIELF